jgi:hypothetical protein
VWGIKVNDQTKQQNLIITDRDQPVITVDNIQVAQFIYLLLENEEIRGVIDKGFCVSDFRARLSAADLCPGRD